MPCDSSSEGRKTKCPNLEGPSSTATTNAAQELSWLSGTIAPFLPPGRFQHVTKAPVFVGVILAVRYSTAAPAKSKRQES
mmetsp:Transcript_26028/g.39555  ORF Transcript_26028/g.39555 Transcript_26028/m.39555 type:complete len:80 (-) Transcript_26028:144-383(-)